MAAVIGPSTHAQASYEPNDSLSTAVGPVLAGQPLVASLESTIDRDFYFFYVAAAGGASTALTVENLGGSTHPASEIEARILDSFGAYAGGNFAYLRPGEARTSTVPLQSGKYFLEVFTREGQGDAYRLIPGGATGAFVGYAEIAARCAGATAAIAMAQRRVDRAETKLERAISRVRRSRFGSERARRAARSLRERAVTRLAKKRRALRAVSKSREPWCTIPQ
jgi:hypothetical protein